MGGKFLNFILLAVLLLLSSCATLSRNGVGRVKRYTIESDKLPSSFDGVTIAFLSDLHYPSKFSQKRLKKVARCLKEISPDAIMLGGDYVSSGDSALALFSSFSSIKTPYGVYAVRGNHDNRPWREIDDAASSCGVVLLDDSFATLTNGGDSAFVVGVRNSFEKSPAVKSIIDSLSQKSFVLLLSHTPDFAQDNNIACDLVLSGHTHGGQVSFWGIYTPVKNTKYGSRFLRGKNFTDNGVAVITTNGVGTSRRKVRFCVPSEIVLVRLVRGGSR